MKNNKFLKVMATTAILSSVVAPVVAIPTASFAAMDPITATTVPTVSDGTAQTFGTIRVVVPAGTYIKNGDSVIVKLPYDMGAKLADAVDSFGPGKANNINIPGKFNGEFNGFASVSSEENAGKANAATEGSVIAREATSAATSAANAAEKVAEGFSADTTVLTSDQIIVANAAAKKANDAFTAAANAATKAKAAATKAGFADDTEVPAVPTVPTAISEFTAASTNNDVKTALTSAKNSLNDYVSYFNIAVTKMDGVVSSLTSPKLDSKVIDTDRIEVKYNGISTNLINDGVFFVNLGSLLVDSGDNGEQSAKIEAPSTSAFPNGEVVIGKVSSQSQVTVSSSSLDTTNDDFTPKVNIAESVAGAFLKDNEIKIKLPSGYKFTQSKISVDNVTTTYGNDDARKALRFTYSDNDRELRISFADYTADRVTKLEIKTPFEVDDETLVKAGDVVAKVSGKTNSSVSELVLGTYGEYSNGVSAVSATEILAGKSEQQIGDIEVKEAIAGSLQEGRSITLELPDGARWNEDSLPTLRYTEGLRLKEGKVTGTDKRTLKYIVDKVTSDDPGKITFEKGEIHLDADFSGDLNVEVGGTTSLTGKVKAATVKAPISVASSTVPNVIIGQSSQAAADFTITENVAGAFANEKKDEVGTTNTAVEHNKVEIFLPEGAKFVGTPSVTVTDGNLSIKDVKVSDHNRESDRSIKFTVNGESTTASTIKVTGVKIQLDRTLPEGPLKVKVGGNALVETSNISNWAENAAEVAIANVATPAPQETKGNATFVVGQTAYKANGVDGTLDVAPYIKDNRTFVPLRALSEALGATVGFDEATRTVSILNGGKAVSLTIGSKIMNVGGVPVALDVAPEITNNRAFLPFRAIAEALGATVDWNQDTQTVTIK